VDRIMASRTLIVVVSALLLLLAIVALITALNYVLQPIPAY
jgi:hypothetical protein